MRYKYFDWNLLCIVGFWFYDFMYIVYGWVGSVRLVKVFLMMGNIKKKKVVGLCIWCFYVVEIYVD